MPCHVKAPQPSVAWHLAQHSAAVATIGAFAPGRSDPSQSVFGLTLHCGAAAAATAVAAPSSSAAQRRISARSGPRLGPAATPATGTHPPAAGAIMHLIRVAILLFCDSAGGSKCYEYGFFQ